MNDKFADVLSIHNTALRCQAEGIPIPEKAIRRWCREGSLPCTRSGNRTWIFFPNVVELLKKGMSPPRDEPTNNYGALRRIDE